MNIHSRISKWLLVLFVPLIFALPMIAQGKNSQPVGVISPGHGWWDPISQQIAPGASNGDLIEKDINLAVAHFARDYLKRCPVDVYLTRNQDDMENTLSDVTEIVNGYQPTIGVSIHTNSDVGLNTCFRKTQK